MVAPTLSLGESRAELGLGIVGFCTALVVIFSPSWSTFKAIVSTKQVGATKPYSYSAVVFNSGIWVVFGIPIIIKLSHGHHALVDWLSLPLMLANIIGIIVEAAYVGVFIRFAAADSRRWPIVSLVAALSAPVVVLGFLLGLVGCSRTFVGYIAMFSGVAMYVIPVIGTYTAYKANDYTQISPDQAGASFVNGAERRGDYLRRWPADGLLYCWLKYRAPPRDLEAGDEHDEPEGPPAPPRDQEAGDVSDEPSVPRDGDDRSRVPGAGGDAVASVEGAGGGGGGEIQMTGMQAHVADPAATEDPKDALAEVGGEVVKLGGGNSEDEVEKQVREKEGEGRHSSDDDHHGGYDDGIAVEKPEEDKAEGDKEIPE